MEFDWWAVLLVFICVGVPGFGMGGVMAIADEHPILGTVLLVAALVLFCCAAGIPEDII